MIIGSSAVIPRYRVALVVMWLAAASVMTGPFCRAESPVQLMEQGKQSLMRGDTDRAIEQFSQVIGQIDPADPNAPLVLILRARCYIKKDDLRSAWKDLVGVLKAPGASGETRAMAYRMRAYLYMKKRRDQAALRDLTRAIKTRHDNDRLRAQSFAYRGILFTRLGEYDKAVSDLNQAITLDPDCSLAYAARGRAYLRKDETDRARRDANRALGMKPSPAVKRMAKNVLKALSLSYTGPDRVSVPLQKDGHLYVRVRFGPQGTKYRFMLDTGATNSLVSRKMLRRISRETKVIKVGRGRAITADGTAHWVTRYRVKDAFIYNLPLGDIEVHVFDRERAKVFPLLGAKSLKKLSVTMVPSAGKAEIRLVEPEE